MKHLLAFILAVAIALPACADGRIIPAKISEFVASEYPDGIITSISKDRRKYDVEVDDHIDLEFDLKGNFLRYDD